MEETGVADEEEAAESDEPDGAGRKTVTRYRHEIGIHRVAGIAGSSVGGNRRNGRRGVGGGTPRGAPACVGGWRIAAGRGWGVGGAGRGGVRGGTLRGGCAGGVGP